MPRDNSPVPTMCGRLARAMKVPRPSGVRPINPEEFIVQGTAIKQPDNNFPIRERVEQKEFDPLTSKSNISVPLVPQNSKVSAIKSSSRERSVTKTVRSKGTWKSHVLDKKQKEQKRMQKERDDEATRAHAKEVFLRYSLPVRIGQWQNAACIHEQHVNDIANRFENGLNFNQQKQLVLEYLHEKMELSVYSDYLQYEMRVQIVSDSEYVMSNGTEQISTRLMLSTIISDTDMIENKTPYVIQSGSLVTLSHHHCRIRRNVFCFVKCPIEHKPQKSAVLHCDNLYIRLFCRGSRKPVYLRCETLNTETFGHNREHMLLTVSETVDKYCQFQLQSVLEFQRRFQVRDHVLTFARVLICHTMTRRYLSVDERLFNGSLIVGREFKACCFTAKDCNNRLTIKNYWVIKTREVDQN